MNTVIILSGVPYKGFKQRPHHFAKYFIENGYEVLYIGILEDNKICSKTLLNIKDKASFYEQVFYNNDDGVYVLKGNNVEEKGNLVELLKKINEIYSDRTLTYIVAFPEWIKYLESIPENSKLIYDCIDDWDLFLTDVKLNFTKELIYRERKLASIAHLVLASAKRLYTKMAYYNDNVYYLPNGVWQSDYLVSHKRRELPRDLVSIKKPTVFFMGAVAEWVDIDLIEYIAKSRPEYSFVFVGHERVKLPNYSNIYFLGIKKYEELPNYLFHSRLAIIPFKVNNLTAAVTPLKLYEYLSSGTPVVSTIMPDIIGLQGLKIAANYDQFLKYLDEIISMKEEEYHLECKNAVQAAEEFDWNILLEPVRAYIETDQLPKMNKMEFINDTVKKYLQYEHHNLIKNELLNFYTFLGEHDLACSLFESENLIDEQSNVDYEKLALAYLSRGELKKAIDFTRIYLKLHEDNTLLETYFEHLLQENNRETLLKIFLLKISGNTYDALKVADSLVSQNKRDPKGLGLLCGLYLDIAEFDIAFQLALEILTNYEDVRLEEIFDINVITFIIHTLSEHSQFKLAEEFCLSLTKISKEWEKKATELLSQVYFFKNLE